jgi:tripartite ATP-independent transporter DctP family solute receptor
MNAISPSRRLLPALLGMGLALGMAAAASAATTLRVGVGTAPLSPETKALQEMARLVDERSKGELKIEVFDSDKLGESVAQIENLQLGTQDLLSNVADWYQYLDKDWAALAMPFLFDGVDHVKRFQATDTYKQWLQNMIDKSGVRMLADNWYRLPRVLLTRTPVFKPEDLEGMKLRMPNLDTYLETWGALGAKPTVISYSEAFLALKTGTVDGMEAPLSGIFSQKFYQAAPYITLTEHQIAPYTVIASEIVWQKLPPDQQAILAQAAKDAGDWYYKQILDGFAGQKRQMLKEGAAFIEVDKAPFAAKVDTVIQKFEDEGKLSKGLVQQIRSLAN